MTDPESITGCLER